jgi:phosphoserine aminotransferase
MSRVFNFSAGPAAIPLEVLEKAQKELVDYKGKGLSVMEMSHRSSEFLEIFNKAVSDLRTLMNIPDDYSVLFLQGGASSQFAMVPLNLLSEKKKADYVNTGMWSKKAISEGRRYGQVRVVASSEDQMFSYIPELRPDMFDPEAAYVHITTNNTIYGTRYMQLPDVGDVPLVADMSSNILGEVYDIRRFGLVYAGAQKNIGPAGLTVVIIRKDLLGRASNSTPAMFSYTVHHENESMYNTPPCYAIYIAGLVFEWLLQRGGVAEMEQINRKKAALLYDFLDNSAMFRSTVRPEYRSLMNVPFVTGSEELDARFIVEASAKGLKTLKGHRSVGGMRASIYNAMPYEGVAALVDFMKAFERNNR